MTAAVSRGRLLDALSDQREGPQLAHIATDGETYGHHHAFGDMALAYALDHIESSGLAKVTNYGEFLEKHPAEHDVEILENTAWSCVHGVGRWNANCGCNSGGHGDWNQEWRAPLRAALDWLRDEIAPCYEKMAAAFLQGSLGGAEQLHPRHSGPFARKPRALRRRQFPAQGRQRAATA